VAPGKLADLVLLDANPLADITNTTTIWAVVANGRYFNRVALDEMLTEVQAKAKAHAEVQTRFAQLLERINQKP
jgi:cytosine/adenosine deaminase-related metal-dependent hydrolase